MAFNKRNGGPPFGGLSQAKRGKMSGEWEDSPSQFEEELLMLEEAEMEMEEMESQTGHDVIPVGEFLPRQAHIFLLLRAKTLKSTSADIQTGQNPFSPKMLKVLH